MKNPWMSLWLSAANKAGNTARGMWMAEARRQQQALTKEIAKASVPGAPTSQRKPKPKRRKSTAAR